MEELVRLRESKRLSQVEVAKILDISPQRYNMYENGKRKMPIEIAKKFAEYFKVSLDAIFSGQD